MNAPLQISKMRTTIDHGIHRLSADVDGAEVWFESADVPLFPSPEGLASAFLVHALHGDRTLTIEAPLSAAWLANMKILLEIFHGW